MKKLLIILAIFFSTFISYEISAQTIDKSKLTGTWYLSENKINYPSLTFHKHYAVLTSRGDTVYNYKYFLQGNDLVLVDMFDKKFKNAIVALDADSLIFETLLENKEVQRYYRNKNTSTEKQ
jgi:hypothetical protein